MYGENFIFLDLVERGEATKEGGESVGIWNERVGIIRDL